MTRVRECIPKHNRDIKRIKIAARNDLIELLQNNRNPRIRKFLINANDEIKQGDLVN